MTWQMYNVELIKDDLTLIETVKVLATDVVSAYETAMAYYVKGHGEDDSISVYVQRVRGSLHHHGRPGSSPARHKMSAGVQAEEQ